MGRPVQVHPHQQSPAVLDSLVVSFKRSLQARNLARSTIVLYVDGVERLVSYLRERGLPLDPEYISREHVELYMSEMLERPTQRTGEPPKTATLSQRYRILKIWFNWLVDMDEIKHSPMERMKPPKLVQESRPVLAVEQVRALVKACEGKRFLDRRDVAIVRLFIDTGMRLFEMAALELKDIDWDNQSITIRQGKGRKARTVYFGMKALRALDQYVNLKGGRRDHRAAHLPNLWLGQMGSIGKSGIYEMIRMRGRKAGVPFIHPHLWRHYFIHASMKKNVQLGDLMRQTGHTRVDMLLKYGEAAADERARESHRRLGPGDDI